VEKEDERRLPAELATQAEEAHARAPTSITTERIRAQIDQLLTTDRDLGEVLEDVARLGARLLLQTALEAEVIEFLGRGRYARGERTRAGYRNGHTELTVKTTAGPSPWPGPSWVARASRSPADSQARA
jgi:hypothetical protein